MKRPLASGEEAKSGDYCGDSRGRDTLRKAARLQRQREQQMGFGTALPGSLPALLEELLPIMCSASAKQQGESPLAAAEWASGSRDVVLCDIGAGSGNVLSDVEDSQVLGDQVEGSRLRLWGVEMNLAFCSETPKRWRDLIYWCKLEELVGTNNPHLKDTNIAYMYDLCLKRLTRKARAYAGGNGVNECEDPHELIQRVLLSSNDMPALRYFISTYSPTEMNLGKDNVASRVRCGNTWKLVLQKKLPCSTDSYMFYVYERVARI